MTLDEKVRYGMMALGGASVVFATLGVHVSPAGTHGRVGRLEPVASLRPALRPAFYLHQQLLELPEEFGLVERPRP